jgi:hypothetical protein
LTTKQEIGPKVEGFSTWHSALNGVSQRAIPVKRAEAAREIFANIANVLASMLQHQVKEWSTLDRFGGRSEEQRRKNLRPEVPC